MKIIAGLGNPGARYARTRHNVGYRVVDLAARKLGAEIAREKYFALTAEVRRDDSEALLLKPLTFMNNSGVSVARAVRYKNAALEDLLVVVDDVNLPLGKLRLRLAGSAGGHNGLKSIIDHLGSDQFARLRVGIGPGGGGPLTDHVLGTFAPDEFPEVDQAVERAADAVLCFIKGGPVAAMNRFNV